MSTRIAPEGAATPRSRSIELDAVDAEVDAERTPHLGDIEFSSSSPSPNPNGCREMRLSTAERQGGGSGALPTLPAGLNGEENAVYIRGENANTHNNNNLSIINVLEVENELRKREDNMNDEGGLERLSERDDETASSDTASYATERAGNQTPGGDVRLRGGVGAGEAPGALRVDTVKKMCLRGEEGGEIEWEDFMANYWQSRSRPSAVTPSEAKRILAAEDTDLRPCIAGPELDEDAGEGALSTIRTGCMDIDMDFNNPSASNEDEGDGDSLNYLSELGLACSLAAARAAAAGGGGLEGLRIEFKGTEESEGRNSLRRMSDTNSDQTPAPTRPSGTVPQSQSAAKSSQGQPGPALASPSSPRQSDATSSYDGLEMKSTRSSMTAGSETGTGATSSEAGSGIPEWKHKISPLPNNELINMIGPVLTRTSLRSLVMKKWHPSYWMHYGPTTLLIFRSKDHMDDWRYNPYHGKKQRDFLVKLKIDFLGDMELQRQDSVGGGVVGGWGGGGNKELQGGGSGVLGHRILPVKKKSYGADEMYQFKLERWTNLGCSVLAAFASQEEDEVQILHDTIGEILKSCPHNGLKNIDHMLK